MKRFVLLLALTLTCGTAHAGPFFSELLVFGDSLVDSGNAHLGHPSSIPDPTPASLGYYQGRFTNGYNFADDLGLHYTGTPATAFLAGGTNFAVGGATAAFHAGETSPSFLPQLQLFAGTLQPIPSNALVVVTFGGNDVRGVISDPNPVDFTPTLTAMASGLSLLAGAGAEHIVVTGIPDIGALPVSQPFGSAATALATARSEALNAQFAAITSSLALSTGADIQFFDLFGLEQSLLANPAAFGLPPLDTVDTCQSGGPAAVLSCNGYLYFDPIHPTAQVHAVIADAIEQQLAVPEPRSWTLLVAGFALMAVGGAGLRSGRTRRKLL